MPTRYAQYLPGFKPGCLPRTDRVGEHCPLFGEHIRVIPRQEADQFVGKVTLQPFAGILNQGRVGSCFPAGTSIRMADGSEKPIEDVRVSESVLTAEGRVGTVTDTMVRPYTGKLIKIIMGNDWYVRCTPEHPILTNTGYLEAQYLRSYHKVALPGLGYEPGWFSPLAFMHDDFVGDVFNIEVEGDHSYVAEGIGVHNCASEASSGALITTRVAAGLPHITVNPYFVYHHVSGGRDQGSTIGDNLRFLREKGVVPESVYPRSRGWQARPPAEAYDAALGLRILEYYDIRTLDEVITALVKGFPVVYGANGHAVYKCAHVPNTGLDVNSWGTQWKNGGFGVWVPYSGMQLRYGVFAIRTVTENEALFDI
jgi:hypothetical protein